MKAQYEIENMNDDDGNPEELVFGLRKGLEDIIKIHN